MIPHKQTILEEKRGNCLATCVASILELPLEEVPNFIEAERWEVAFHEWLKGRGLMAIDIDFYSANGKPDVECLKRAYVESREPLCVLYGVSPRKRADGKDLYHAVVGRAKGWGFEVVHDPHPSNEGIVGGPFGVCWIVPRFVSKKEG